MKDLEQWGVFPILTKIITNTAYYMRKIIDKMKRVLF